MMPHFIFLALLLPSLAAQNKGLTIAQKIHAANRGFVGDVSKTTMVLIDSAGQKVERIMDNKIVEMANGEDRSLIAFIIPNDVKGTKMLSWKRNELTDNDQWIYLPSLMRIKRIHGGQRSSSFMGSEFSYEDIGTGQVIEKFHHKLVSEVPGQSWTVQQVPKTTSGYSKKIVTYSVKHMNVLKIQYYDRKGELLKVATFSDWKPHQVKGKKLWRAGKVNMRNVQTKKESILIYNNRRLGIKLSRRDFRKDALR